MKTVERKRVIGSARTLFDVLNAEIENGNLLADVDYYGETPPNFSAIYSPAHVVLIFETDVEANEYKLNGTYRNNEYLSVTSLEKRKAEDARLNFGRNCIGIFGLFVMFGIYVMLISTLFR